MLVFTTVTANKKSSKIYFVAIISVFKQFKYNRVRNDNNSAG